MANVVPPTVTFVKVVELVLETAGVGMWTCMRCNLEYIFLALQGSTCALATRTRHLLFADEFQELNSTQCPVRDL